MEIKVQEPPSAGAAMAEPVAQEIQQAVAEAGKIGEIEADGRFIEELTEAAKENEEKTSRNSTEDSKDSRAQRDTAALSYESRHYKLSPDELSDLEKMWGREEADLAWEDILNWSPSAAKPFTDELSELSAIYDQLLHAILTNTTAGVREGQLTALDQILSDILLELQNTCMGELYSFFSNFGTSGSVKALQAALYRSVTGNSPNHRELELVFKDTFRSAEKSDTAPGTGKEGSIHTPVYDMKSVQKQGIIYQPAGAGRIRNNSQYAARIQKEAATGAWGGKTTEGSAYAKAYGAEASITAVGKNSVYAPRDLDLADRFAGYMNHAGNLFEMEVLSGGSEELYGFLAAIMCIKSQTYAGIFSMDPRVFSDLREAVDRMIDYYIQKAFRQSGEAHQERTGSRTRVFEPKAAYKIYYYMMNLYYSSGSLQETANKGIRHAYQQFLRKKEAMRGEEDSRSFFTTEKPDAKEDWKEGKRVLERDWKEFLDFSCREYPGGISPEVLELSPWGMLAEPETHSDSQGTVNPMFTLGAVGAVLLLILFIGYMGA